MEPLTRVASATIHIRPDTSAFGRFMTDWLRLRIGTRDKDGWMPRITWDR